MIKAHKSIPIIRIDDYNYGHFLREAEGAFLIVSEKS